MPNRREFLQTATGLVAGSIAFSTMAQADTGTTTQSPLEYFVSKGFAELHPYTLTTTFDFNGGVRYDDTAETPAVPRWVRLQGCARLEDIGRRDKVGVLPYFHILSLGIGRPKFHGELLTLGLDFLINKLRFAPDRLALISTDNLDVHNLHLKRHGLKPDQVLKRDLNEARAAGTGDGYFEPQGHPHTPSFPSVSVYYFKDAKPSKLKYPLDGALEVGEFSVHPEPGHAELGGFGMERLQMAQGLATPTFEESRQELLEVLKSEARDHCHPLPPAYEIYSSMA